MILYLKIHFTSQHLPETAFQVPNSYGVFITSILLINETRQLVVVSCPYLTFLMGLTVPFSMRSIGEAS